MRLFIALELPSAIQREIETHARKGRNDLPPGSWPKAETYHLTLVFLGEHPESVVQPLTTSLDSALAGKTLPELRLGDFGFFPSPSRPRVGWIAVEPGEVIGEVARLTRGAVRSCGAEFDEKPFRSHVTVVRMREGWSRTAAERLAKQFDMVSHDPFAAGDVTLFSSNLSPHGAVHTPLAKFGVRRT